MSSSTVVQVTRRDRSLALLICVAIAIFVLMAAINPEKFLRPYNLKSITFVAPELGLMSLAIMLSMLTGGFDLSIVAVANCSAILAGLFFHAIAAHQHVPIAGLGLLPVLGGFLVCLCAGALAGAINGVLIARAGITPILATIGSGQLFTGVALVVTGGPAIVDYPSAWGFLGNGSVLGVAMPILIFVAFAVAIGLVLTRTPFGIGLTLIGSNPNAALFAGLNIKRSLILLYTITGLLASVAGILLSARTNAARSDYGTSYLLEAVLIAVLGGTRPSGGRASVIGVSVALLALMFLSSGLQLMRVNSFLIDAIWGIFLLLVISVNAFAFQRGSR